MSKSADRAVRELRENLARQTGVPVRLLVAPPEWGTPERIVLWGGRVGRDAWVGSMWDQMLQTRLARQAMARRAYTVWERIAADLGREMMRIGEAAQRAAGQIGKSMREGGLAPPEV